MSAPQPPAVHPGERSTRDAYSARAAEYIDAFGSAEIAAEADRLRIARWADNVTGTVLDAGCGPGHWSAYLLDRGVAVEGIDMVPEFIARAAGTYPDIPFRTGSLRSLDAADGLLGGVLAWYSLIHSTPADVDVILGEFRRVLAPRGRLLLGFFEGADAEEFPHAVVTARYWSIEGMSDLLERAGFTVVDVESRQDPGRRAHASISAVAV
jgi:SAM-dependent methyltransferase